MPLPILATIATTLAAEFAPALVAKIAGDKAGKVAGAVVDAAAKATGLPIQTQADAQAAAAALRADPNKQLSFQHDMALVELEETKALLADRQDARSRDVELRRLGGGNGRADFLAIGALVGLVGLIWTLLFVQIPDGPARDVLLILSGALVAIVKDVYAFEFGSSRGSKEKDAALKGKL